MQYTSLESLGRTTPRVSVSICMLRESMVREVRTAKNSAISDSLLMITRRRRTSASSSLRLVSQLSSRYVACDFKSIDDDGTCILPRSGATRCVWRDTWAGAEAWGAAGRAAGMHRAEVERALREGHARARDPRHQWHRAHRHIIGHLRACTWGHVSLCNTPPLVSYVSPTLRVFRTTRALAAAAPSYVV